MNALPPIVIYATAAVAVLGTLVVVLLAVRQRRRSKNPAEDKNTVEMACPICQRTLVIHRNQMIDLSGPEIALVVSEKPEIRGRGLAEYRCPHCDAAHCFLVDITPPQWLIANAFEPQAISTCCAECRKPVISPPWPEGQYDGRLEEAGDALLPRHGLICPRCNAVCCVECCRKITRNRTPDGSLLCPRCSRGPVDKVFHFQV